MMKKSIILTLSLIAMTSCATVEQERAATKGALIGAAAGAVIGADQGKAVEGAVIGGAVGAAAGAVLAEPQGASSAPAQRIRRHRHEEEWEHGEKIRHEED